MRRQAFAERLKRQPPAHDGLLYKSCRRIGGMYSRMIVLQVFSYEMDAGAEK